MSTLELDDDLRLGDDLETSAEGRSVYERLRADIIAGRLEANARLKVRMLADRYGVSTNPVREALQQLRGEGFVVISPNRGARVRTVDAKFIHDTSEIEMLIEPFLTRWFVGIATQRDVDRLEEIQAEIETLNFRVIDEHNKLDTAFHRLMYERHPNQHMLDLWWNHRDILGAVARGLEITLNRRAAVLREHRAVIAAIKAQDGDTAAAIIAQHVEGSGKMWIEQLRASRRG